MAHAMLPRKEEFVKGEKKYNPAKFVDTSIQSMVEALLALGCLRSHLVAKVIGGAQMFPILASRMDVGQRNIVAARDTLKQLEIPLVGEDTGGNRGRTVYFNLETGEVEVKYAQGRGSIRI
jgi:chemotaxis protein CheD